MKIHGFHSNKSDGHEPSPPRSRTAFTLIELLVVIAIIGLLASLLLPALARGKGEARKTSCLSRLKQWNIALMLYAEDNEDSIPRESAINGGTIINLWIQVQTSSARDVWYNALPEYADGRRAATYYPLAVRPDFYDRDQLFHCPSATFPKGVGVDENAFFSYAMNSKLILNPFRTMKLSSIDNPSATVTFLDNRLPAETKVDPAQENDNLGQPSAYSTRFVTRHLQRGLLSFADGHAEPVRGRDVVTNGWAHYPQTKIIWTADPRVNPNSEIIPP
jgi:prepilin-type N-terminal cleavage/methylation domain-containing protein